MYYFFAKRTFWSRVSGINNLSCVGLSCGHATIAGCYNTALV